MEWVNYGVIYFIKSIGIALVYCGRNGNVKNAEDYTVKALR